MQIIFSATDDEGHRRAALVRHLMALQSKEDKALAEKAVHDWYSAEKKNYAVFASKCGLDGELKVQGKKLQAMDD